MVGIIPHTSIYKGFHLILWLKTISIFPKNFMVGNISKSRKNFTVKKHFHFQKKFYGEKTFPRLGKILW